MSLIWSSLAALTAVWHHYRPLVNSWQLFANTGEGFDLLATGKGHQVTETAPDLFMRFIASLESL
ncbi:hypothetical protein KFZ76_21375 [Methylovulum psychrotolerans]|uniref:hypothetical protein n=1 Tax=Methylovulum psychrotolerans TaxID=1704499 RepID=UPI001BFF07AF|nr:hypothetical protein [Methylovulum psychrotolerans]MBT9100254.1 hypothetical protein [Methylovulum psychrotolerans]